MDYQDIIKYIRDIFSIDSLFDSQKKYESAVYECLSRVFADRKDFSYKDGDKNRDILQHYGELIREYDAYFWIKALTKKIDLNHNNIITDVRLMSEYHKLRKSGFSLIRIIASNDVRKKLLGDNHFAQINHSTEINLDNIETWDYIIYNNGDLADLEIKALDMVKYVEEKTTKDFSLSQ